MNLYSLQSIPNLTPAFVISCCVQVKQGRARLVLLWKWLKYRWKLVQFCNFGTVLMDGKMNNIIILQHQKPCAFLQSISSTWPPLFGLNLKNWYLSKMISFLKCPFIPTFLLIEARRYNPKNGNVFSQGPVCLGVFCHIFPACLSAFKSDICKHNRRTHVRLHNILFYFNFFKKEKMKWNEMRKKPCVE